MREAIHVQYVMHKPQPNKTTLSVQYRLRTDSLVELNVFIVICSGLIVGHQKNCSGTASDKHKLGPCSIE